MNWLATSMKNFLSTLSWGHMREQTSNFLSTLSNFLNFLNSNFLNFLKFPQHPIKFPQFPQFKFSQFPQFKFSQFSQFKFSQFPQFKFPQFKFSQFPLHPIMKSHEVSWGHTRYHEVTWGSRPWRQTSLQWAVPRPRGTGRCPRSPRAAAAPGPPSWGEHPATLLRSAKAA